MILREATIKYKGYDPNELSKGSNKRICVSCDKCGRIRWVIYRQYKDLCYLCSMKLNSGKNSSRWRGGNITLICKWCGDEFKVTQSLKNQKFCSYECAGKWKSENLIGKDSPNYKGGLVTKICKKCGNEYKVNPGNINTKFCSKKCKNNSLLKLELTDEDRQNNRLIKGYNEWRNEVFKRDNYMCQICGNNNLNAHHIESYNNNPELRTTLDNGITLCTECHKNFHHIYGYNCTKEQFIEFMGN